MSSLSISRARAVLQVGHRDPGFLHGEHRRLRDPSKHAPAIRGPPPAPYILLHRHGKIPPSRAVTACPRERETGECFSGME